MDDPGKNDLAAEFLALRAANDQLRESGKQWLWDLLDRISAEISRQLTARPGEAPLQVGRQAWQFAIENQTMVGERFGARHRGRTLLVEVGWPRLPEHGFVPNRGLARGRVGLSQNTMLQPTPLADLILSKPAETPPQWRLIKNNALGEPVSESMLRNYFQQLIIED
ncbi:MAG: hypothetical protein SF339_23875 [Blastocatellia bacterium]|nr:hypothetical protein [Blastocatellia bacterium]